MSQAEMEKLKPRLEEFLTRLLELARLDLKFQMRDHPQEPSEPDAPELTVEFSGADTDLLLQRGGELLEALEDVATRALRLPPEERGGLVFDCLDYKTLRLEELRLTAETAAERVAHTGAPFSLSPMNSRDRRIIHLSLKANPAVRTESEGFGPYRKVVIFPAEKK